MAPVSPMRKGPLDRLEARIAAGEMDADPAQLETAARLEALAAALDAWRPSRGWRLAGLFGPKGEPPRGLYIYGQVGRGKTMLMDLFFEQVPVRRKRRVHFNAFMADVHDRINRHRQALKRGETREGDPIPPVARALADEAWVLCCGTCRRGDCRTGYRAGRAGAGGFVAYRRSGG